MLAPLIINLLIVSLLLLLIGWMSDILHASAHDGPTYVNEWGSIGCNARHGLRTGRVHRRAVIQVPTRNRSARSAPR
jgi:hypothetical protein